MSVCFLSPSLHRFAFLLTSLPRSACLASSGAVLRRLTGYRSLWPVGGGARERRGFAEGAATASVVHSLLSLSLLSRSFRCPFSPLSSPSFAACPAASGGTLAAIDPGRLHLWAPAVRDPPAADYRLLPGSLTSAPPRIPLLSLPSILSCLPLLPHCLLCCLGLPLEALSAGGVSPS